MLTSSSAAGIDTLPMDVLGEIFSFITGHITVLYKSRNALCAVSHRWRRIALAYPRLWSYLILDMTLRYPPVPVVHLWLERSADAPLEVSFASSGFLADLIQDQFPLEHRLSGDGDNSNQYQYALSVLNALTTHIHHLAKVRFFDIIRNDTATRVARLLKDVPFNRAVQLRNLSLTFQISGLDEEGILAALAQAPRLEKFHLTVSNDTRIVNGTISFPWDRFKDVHLSNIRTSHLSSIIPQCASATTIHIHSLLANPLQLQPQTTISLSALRGLSLICYRDIFCFIGQLECPRLEVLQLKLYTEWDYAFRGPEADLNDFPELWDYLFSFLRSSKHSLRVLFIEDPDEMFTEDGLSTFLANPRLMELIALKVAMENVGWVWDAYETTESLPVGEMLQLDEVTTHDGEDILRLGWVLDGRLQEFLRERPYIKDLFDDETFLKVASQD